MQEVCNVLHDAMWHKRFSTAVSRRLPGGDEGVDADAAAHVAPETEEAAAGQSTQPASAEAAKGIQPHLVFLPAVR